jgi:stress-induced morphogen
MLNRTFNRPLKNSYQKLSLKNNATMINIESKLRKSFTNIDMLDISTVNGDCGQSYFVKIRSGDFLGKSLLDQHRMINEIIKEEVKVVHSIVLQTRT